MLFIFFFFFYFFFLLLPLSIVLLFLFCGGLNLSYINVDLHDPPDRIICKYNVTDEIYSANIQFILLCIINNMEAFSTNITYFVKDHSVYTICYWMEYPSLTLLRIMCTHLVITCHATELHSHYWCYTENKKLVALTHLCSKN